MDRIAIFASGNGSNAENLIRYFNSRDDATVRVVVVLVNNPKARVIQRAQDLGVPVFVFDKSQLYDSSDVISCLHRRSVTFIVLAGFLLRMPEAIVELFPLKIVNIHPALLPKFGGRGMYGMNVHRAVIAAGERISGITIHYVNNYYDEGEITLQKTVDVNPADTPDVLAHKIHLLEMEWLPREVERLLLKQRNV